MVVISYDACDGSSCAQDLSGTSRTYRVAKVLNLRLWTVDTLLQELICCLQRTFRASSARRVQMAGYCEVALLPQCCQARRGGSVWYVAELLHVVVAAVGRRDTGVIGTRARHTLEEARFAPCVTEVLQGSLTAGPVNMSWRD